jgi:hypothetical protein
MAGNASILAYDFQRSNQEPMQAEMMFTCTLLLFAVTGADLPSGQRRLYEVLRGPAKIARAMGAKPLSWAQGVLATKVPV